MYKLCDLKFEGFVSYEWLLHNTSKYANMYVHIKGTTYIW